jgi:hypothetical protein
MQKWKHPASLIVVNTAMCAALYAIGSYMTSFVVSPWGVGQFRPAVIVPALFATIFGPWVGGVGAALGTLIADSAKHGTLYFGSLLAAVPGNFIGFFLFGYILKRKFTWGRFVAISNVTLVVANLIVGFLYVFAYKLLYSQSPQYMLPTEALTLLSLGLTIFWFITMLPFVLIFTPLLIKVVAIAFPGIVPEDVRTHSLKMELPRKTFCLAMLIPGLIMIGVGLATTYSPFGSYLASNFSKTFPSAVMDLLQILFYGSGIALSIIGIAVFALRSSTHKGQE